MTSEKSPRLGWLRIGLPNETPQDQVDGLIQEVAEYKLEGVIYSPGDFIDMGTIIEASIMATDFRDLPEEGLSPQEQTERDRIEEMFHDFEFDDN